MKLISFQDNELETSIWTSKKKIRNLKIFNFNSYHITQHQCENKLVEDYKTYWAYHDHNK